MAEPHKSSTDNILKPAVLQSPIIMKVDGPVDDSVKKDNLDNEQIEAAPKIEEFKTCSPSFRSIVPSTNPFASSISAQTRIGRGILKPPQLNVNNVSTSNNKAFVLKPSQLSPFAKNSESSDKTNGDKTQNVVNGEAPKFVPLIVEDNKKSEISSSTSSKQATSTATSIKNSTFVFGQNLQERVIGSETTPEEPKASTSLSSNGTTNSTTEMLFSSVLKNEVKTETEMKEKETKSLSESAREYEESRASKRKYEEVEVITGEENENNILKISCKLFSFDKTASSWQERGRGLLRLNDFKIDDEHIGSRIVFRTTGSLRVILNTKIWAEMTVDKASEKSIRLTALDANGEVKVFLLMSNIEDSSKLFSHLRVRLDREITTQRHKKIVSNSNSDTDSGGN